MKPFLVSAVLVLPLALGLLVAPSPVASATPPAAGGGWRLVYENTPTGAALSGSLTDLVAAVERGADVKVRLGSAFRIPNRVDVLPIGGETHVGCQFTNVALVLDVAPVTLRPEPYHAYSWVDSSGGYGLARASVYTGNDFGQTTTTVAAQWWVRP